MKVCKACQFSEVRTITENTPRGPAHARLPICTHEQCVISENYDVQGEEVECTCHGSQFNVKTGANILPPAAEPLKTFKVLVEDEEVFVEA